MSGMFGGGQQMAKASVPEQTMPVRDVELQRREAMKRQRVRRGRGSTMLREGGQSYQGETLG